MGPDAPVPGPLPRGAFVFSVRVLACLPPFSPPPPESPASFNPLVLSSLGSNKILGRKTLQSSSPGTHSLYLDGLQRLRA